MARYHIRQIGFDGNDLDALIGFWTRALDYEVDHRAAGYAVLRDRDGVQPRILLQKVPELKAGKNRAHIDIEVPDEQAAVGEFIALGATVLWRKDFHPKHWTVLADPQGNEFCVGYFG